MVGEIMSESVHGENKKCPTQLFRLQPFNDPSITKSMCKQKCNENARCNFYAYWTSKSGLGDCRGYETCPYLVNEYPGYKNILYKVQRLITGAPK